MATIAMQMAKGPGHPKGSPAETQSRWDTWRQLHLAGWTLRQIAEAQDVTEPAVRYAVRRKFVAASRPPAPRVAAS